MNKSTLIYNARLLDEFTDEPGAILIIDGKIRSIFKGFYTTAETVSSFAKAVLVEDGYGENAKIDLFNANGLTVTPSFIDMHVHLRYPGQIQKEDLESGLHAAVAGGYGTVVAMPNTNPVVSSIDMAMKIEREAAALGLAHLFQVVSITKDFDGQTTNHLNMMEKKYVPVISEDGRDVLSSSVMLEGMRIAASKGIIVSCHCEDPNLAAAAKPYRVDALKILNEKGNNGIKEAMSKLTKANALLADAEDIATERNITLAERVNCHVHLAHVSTAKSIEIIRQEKKKGAAITCEVTPHHLGLSADENGSEEDKKNMFHIVNPPLRSAYDVAKIREAIADGTVDVISTDHAPHTIDDKKNGAPGFTGIEVAYAVCNKNLICNGVISESKLSKLMSSNPARILGLNKGLLKSGYDADLTFVDPEEQWVVKTEEFYSKGKYSPVEGETLTGRVKNVFIDGRLVFERQ